MNQLSNQLTKENTKLTFSKNFVPKKKTEVKVTIDNLEESFTDICNDLTKAFYRLDRVKNSQIEDIKNIASQLQSHMMDYNALINDIILYGSSEDCIYRHCINVAILSYVLGEWIGLSKPKLNLLTYSALLHDIGKTKVNDNILYKKGCFSTEEFNIMKSHPVTGYNLIKNVNFLDKSVAQGVLMHHERLDGSGYPFGIQEDKISQFARIIAIADVFDAVNSNRAYHKRKTPFEALRIIKKESFGKLDYEYCNIFINHILNYYNGKDVLLNNKLEAKIVKMDINSLDKPLILLDDGFLELIDNPEFYIDSFVL